MHRTTTMIRSIEGTKSGTTWTQQIVGQLIFGGEPGVDVASISPWVDLRVPPREVKLPALEAQSHRRFLKTHLPVDALVFSPVAKYLYVARDGRDVVWSKDGRPECRERVVWDDYVSVVPISL